MPEVRDGVRAARATSKLTTSEVLIAALRLLEKTNAQPEPAPPAALEPPAMELKQGEVATRKRPAIQGKAVEPETAQGYFPLLNQREAAVSGKFCAWQPVRPRCSGETLECSTR